MEIGSNPIITHFSETRHHVNLANLAVTVQWTYFMIFSSPLSVKHGTKYIWTTPVSLSNGLLFVSFFLVMIFSQ